MCIKLGHKHNIFYLHYFRFQNHSTQRQSFSSYCQRPQSPGQKLKAYFYISIVYRIYTFPWSPPVPVLHHPNQFDCSISALQLWALHLISHISCCCSNFDLSGICMQLQQTAALQHCSRVNTCTASPQCFPYLWFHQLINLFESFASSYEVCEYSCVILFLFIYQYLSIYQLCVLIQY